MGRLQALLEARGIPPHLLGALAPRMQHMLHRSMGSNCRVQQLVQGVQSSCDENQQLQAVIELGQLLVMGNEETLAGFPIKQVVPPLIQLLHMEHNFDMMNHACRALTYLMEALPRSTGAVVEAVPTLLQKLQSIQCIDVAEQALSALELISRRHGKSILQVGGISACLVYVDFFSIAAQRAALSITANCCHSLTPDQFHLVQPNLSVLSQRLSHQDKKTVESVCLTFSRLVHTFKSDPVKLKEIADKGLLCNVQQLLLTTPPLMSSATFCELLKLLRVICSRCPELAVQLLSDNIGDTLCTLLVSGKDQCELVSRNPEELFVLTGMIAELLPALPTDGLFGIDQWLLKLPPREVVVWLWRDDKGNWRNYSQTDSLLIESSSQHGADRMQLTCAGREYVIDLSNMCQLNETSGSSRQILRRTVSLPLTTASAPPPPSSDPTQTPPEAVGSAECVLSSVDPRLVALQKDSSLLANIVRTLFPLLYKVYSSCAGPAVRHTCLRAILRMLYYTPSDLIQELVSVQEVSSNMAGMLSSVDLKIQVAAVQLSEVLMAKLPDLCQLHFRREGVVFQMKQMNGSPAGGASTVSPSLSLSTHHSADLSSSVLTVPSASSLTSAAASSSSSASASAASLPVPFPESVVYSAGLQNSASASDNDPASNLLSDVLKRKRSSKRTGNPSRRSRQEDAFCSDVMTRGSRGSVFVGLAASSGSGSGSGSGLHGSFLSRSRSATSAVPLSTSSATTTTSRFQSSFLASLNPARWGRSSSPLTPPPPPPSQSAGQRERVRLWLMRRAGSFVQHRFTESAGGSGGVTSSLQRLQAALERLHKHETDDIHTALSQVSDVLCNSDISPFEVLQSGMVATMTQFLTADDPSTSWPDRKCRLRLFLHVFANLSRSESEPSALGGCEQVRPLSTLVAKLQACVSQSEQLPVKVHDLCEAGGGLGSSHSALRYFNQNQLKCNLYRWPGCTSLRQWRGGPVKIDPLALVQAIERYLVIRGYGRVREEEDDCTDDGDSEEDIDDTMATVSISQGSSHKLQFVIDNQPLPYNMTVFQAVQQYSHQQLLTSESLDSEHTVGSAHLFQRTHTIYYRPAPSDTGKGRDSAPTPSSSSCSSSARRGHSGSRAVGGARGSGGARRRDELWSQGVVPERQCPLTPLLLERLPAGQVTVSDPSLPSLNLLRLLHALSRHYGVLYLPRSCPPLLPAQEFINSKIAAKASRQLQDAVIVMTGNCPQWLFQLGITCPFLLPFDTRHLLFYSCTFDRDRALSRLMDASPELHTADPDDRIAPKLERKKRSVSRADLLRQAESLLAELASSRALLEVHYDGEVGSGLGPTLEFYSQVCRQMRRPELSLWRGSVCEAVEEAGDDEAGLVASSLGLYPLPLPRNCKASTVSRVRAKFKFLGKLMAKALMDSRLLDLPLAVPFYKWLLREEHSLCVQDVALLDESLASSLQKLQETVATATRLPASQRREVTVDGCPVEELELEFTLPGHPAVELKRGGKDTTVTADSLSQYIQLLSHWLLYESVYRQMEAFREGFESVFSIDNLAMFLPEEMDALFCGSQESCWKEQTLREAFRPDHGYNQDSTAITHLVSVLSQFDHQQRRSFLSFVTGSPRLPVGGFRVLTPPLTVVRKTVSGSESADDLLPSVMTCVNYLKLPDYSSREVMQQRLSTAISEGRLSFMLS